MKMIKGHTEISHRKFIDTVTEPGTVNLITGKRNAGKSSTFVSMMQPLVEGKIKKYDRQTVVITNIVFVQGGHHGRRMPPNVYYADSVEQMFRTILRIFDDMGLKIRIVVGMDEAQQHMLADQNSDPVNQAMLSFLGVIRKFNVSMWFLSPTRMNLAPKVRHFMDDPKAGNLDFLWFKDTSRIKRSISDNHLDTKPNQYITWQGGAADEPHLMFVRMRSWMTKVDDLRRGEYGYDDEAAATFRYSDHPDFDHQTLLDLCSGIPKKEIPGKLGEYFAALDAGEFAKDKKARGEETDQADRVRKAREMKIPWKTIEALESTNRNTLKSRMDKQSSKKEASSKNDENEAREVGVT